jgi:hypothetical protein
VDALTPGLPEHLFDVRRLVYIGHPWSIAIILLPANETLEHDSTAPHS